MSVYTLGQLVARQGDAERDRVAAGFGAETITYGELDRRADRLAAALAAAAFVKGDRVGVLMHNRLEWLDVFFAVARLGGVIVPLNHLLTSPELQYMIEDSGATWIVAEDALWGRVEGLDRGVREGTRAIAVGAPQSGATEFEELAGGGEHPFVAPEVDGDDIFLLQYTSGTTGAPKGATHTHATVMWNAISQRQHFSIDESTVYLCLPALSWVAGFHSLMLETLWSGGRVVLNRTDASFDPVDFCAMVQRERITTVAMVPTVLKRILEVGSLESYDLSSLRTVIAGGEAVPVHLLNEMARRLPEVTGIQVYGMSEFPSLVTLLEPAHAAAKLGSAGRANCVSQVRVVDEAGAACAAMEIGEIVTRSPATMIGYYGKPEATAEALRGGWLHTGDLGYLDADGFLYISGRSKDLIISGGLNIYPAEIEQALIRHPAVAEAAAVPVADPKWGEIVQAVVVVKQGESVSVEELRAALAPSLARYKMPKAWDIREGPALPRTASGKLQKFKIAAAYQRD